MICSGSSVDWRTSRRGAVRPLGARSRIACRSPPRRCPSSVRAHRRRTAIMSPVIWPTTAVPEDGSTVSRAAPTGSTRPHIAAHWPGSTPRSRCWPAGSTGSIPPATSNLLRRSAESGVLVAEAASGLHAHKSRFLTRNRLIAALGSGTVVVEAALRSGALSSARWALDLGRPVMGVPGPVTSMASSGVHELLRQPEPVLVTDVDEVLEHVSPVGTNLAPRKSEPVRPRSTAGSRRNARCSRRSRCSPRQLAPRSLSRPGVGPAEVPPRCASSQGMGSSRSDAAGWRLKLSPMSTRSQRSCDVPRASTYLRVSRTNRSDDERVGGDDAATRRTCRPGPEGPPVGSGAGPEPLDQAPVRTARRRTAEPPGAARSLRAAVRAARVNRPLGPMGPVRASPGRVSIPGPDDTQRLPPYYGPAGPGERRAGYGGPGPMPPNAGGPPPSGNRKSLFIVLGILAVLLVIAGGLGVYALTTRRWRGRRRVVARGGPTEVVPTDELPTEDLPDR